MKNSSQTFSFMEDADERNQNVGAWVEQWTTGGDTFQWVDPPAMYHGNISTCAFSDGHAEGHKWKNSIIIAAGVRAANGQNPNLNASSGATQPDGYFVHENYRFPGWK